MNNSVQNRRLRGFFLLFYLVFLFTGILHYHHYELSSSSSFKQKSAANTASDLYPDIYNICSLHQFSHSFAKLHYSSNDINCILDEGIVNRTEFMLSLLTKADSSPSIPRAPPLFS